MRVRAASGRSRRGAVSRRRQPGTFRSAVDAARAVQRRQVGTETEGAGGDNSQPPLCMQHHHIQRSTCTPRASQLPADSGQWTVDSGTTQTAQGKGEPGHRPGVGALPCVVFPAVSSLSSLLPRTVPWPPSLCRAAVRRSRCRWASTTAEAQTPTSAPVDVGPAERPPDQVGCLCFPRFPFPSVLSLGPLDPHVRFALSQP